MQMTKGQGQTDGHSKTPILRVAALLNKKIANNVLKST